MKKNWLIGLIIIAAIAISGCGDKQANPAGQAGQSSKKIVKVGDIECGSKELFLISGPCVIEEESIMMKTAEKLREVQERLKIKIIYKSSFTKDNRSSLSYYQGPGLIKVD